MGILNAANYSATTKTDLTGLFMIGQDFETYSGKSGALLSGISTLGSDLYFSANYSSTAIPAASVFDYFLQNDVKLVIENGILLCMCNFIFLNKE